MGTNKLLLRFDDKTVIEHILDRLANYETLVVTGHHPEEIEAIIKQHRARTVHNPEYEQGMTTSFQAGLRAINSDVDAVFLVLSDTFGFNSTLLDRMHQKMTKTRALLVSPVYEGSLGHPVLVARKLFQAFLEMGKNETMKDVMKRHKDEHEYVHGDIWVRIDMNTPEDYKRVKKLWVNR
jgi:molybdenum cofactor cytidylyltransferase